MKTAITLILIIIALNLQAFAQPTPAWQKPTAAPAPATPTSVFAASPPPKAVVAVPTPTTLPEALAALSGALSRNQHCEASLAANSILTLSQAEGGRKSAEYQGKADEVARSVVTLQNFVRERARFAEMLTADIVRINSESQRVSKQLAQLDDIVKRKQLAPDRVEDLRESLRTEGHLLQQQLANRQEAQLHLAEDSQSLDDRLFREDLSKQYWELLVTTVGSQTDLWKTAYLKVHDTMEYQCTVERGTYRRCVECEAGLGSPSPATTKIQASKKEK